MTINQTKTSDKSKRVVHLLNKFIVLPYFLGILWFFLHPLLTVTTGELKCRGAYIDENAFLTGGNYPTKPYYKSSSTIASSADNKNNTKELSCEYFSNYINDITNNNNMNCYNYENKFDLLRIIPTKSTLMDPTESIAIIINPNNSNDDDDDNEEFCNVDDNYEKQQECYNNKNNMILVDGIEEFIIRLDESSPWLSKIIFIMFPSQDETLDDTAKLFLKLYATNYDNDDNDDTKLSIIDPFITYPLLRHVIVLDTTSSKEITSNQKQKQPQEIISIATQGQYGTLPNLDLFFMSTYFFRPRQRNGNNNNKKVIVHPYSNEVMKWKSWLDKKLIDNLGISSKKNYKLRFYIDDLFGMIAFMWTMIFGP